LITKVLTLQTEHTGKKHKGGWTSSLNEAKNCGVNYGTEIKEQKLA